MGYGGKTHRNDSQNCDTTAYSGRELFHLQFSQQVASPEAFGYTLLSQNLTMLLSNYIKTAKASVLRLGSLKVKCTKSIEMINSELHNYLMLIIMCMSRVVTAKSV
jgi:hypothetical protein